MWEQTYEIDSESVICAKCDTKFNNEIEHKKHHHIKHKAGNDRYTNENW